MKKNLIITVVLAVGLGVAAGWLVPHPSQTNAASSITAGDPPGATNAGAASADRKIAYYACPMHPTIHYNHGGDCPICGMKLQPIYADETNSPAVTPGCCGNGRCGR